MRRALPFVFVGSILVAAPVRGAPPASSGAPPAAAHDLSEDVPYVNGFGRPARDAWRKPGDVVNLLQLWAGNTVADIGAGTGTFEPWLSRAVGRAGRVLALDAEPRLVTNLQRRVKKEGLQNVSVQRVQPNDPALGESSVDRILVVDAWHDMPERAKYAAALKRALRPGGFVVIVDFTAASPHGPPVQARLSPAAVIADLQAGGFIARTVEESLPLQYAVVGQKPGASTGCLPPSPRQQALVDAINTNADKARFTGGVNTFTVEALQKDLEPTDPELRGLLCHKDAVVVRTAASVFAGRGENGLVVLREASVDPNLPANSRPVVEDVLWTANARRKHLY